jgi:phosphoglycerate kinase
MFTKKSITDIEIHGKKVIVRVDFNVPLDNGEVADDTRIRASLPTIKYLLENNAGVILASHLGRPNGERNLNFSLRPVAEYLRRLVDVPVSFAEDCIGPAAEQAADSLSTGEVLVLENTRFHAGEEANDHQMAEKLANLAEIFVNDAFGTAHRSHASNVGITDYLPAVAGFLMEKEIKYLGNVIADPEKPFTIILGGAKVSGKIGVIKNLMDKADSILIGGGMANTFFAGQGYELGDSLVEEDAVKVAVEIMKNAKSKIILPEDVVIADKFSPEARHKIIPLQDIPNRWQIMDLGPKTLKNFKKIIQKSKVIVWNGPVGVFEFPPFAKGTIALAKLVAKSRAMTIVGGGDSAAAVNQAGVAGKITHVSTGGGASLKMLEGSELPGLEALEDL